MWDNLVWLGKQIQRLSLFENLSGQQIEVNIDELKELQDLFKKILLRLEGRAWTLIEGSWVENLRAIYQNFLKKFGSSNLMEKQFQKFDNDIESTLNEIKQAKNDKNLSQLNILEMSKRKPSLLDAKKMDESVKGLNIVFGKINDRLENYLEDCELFDSYLGMYITDNNNLSKLREDLDVSKKGSEFFVKFEQDLLKLYKKFEELPLHSEKTMLTLISLELYFKVLRLIFESAGQRKWKKTGDLLKQIIAKYPAILPHLKEMRVMELFTEQEGFINRLTEIFLQELVTIEE